MAADEQLREALKLDPYDFSKIREALEDGADVNLVVDKLYGMCALQKATWKGDLEACQFLIGARADINVMDYHKETILFKAVQMGDMNVAKLLLEHNADVNLKNESHETVAYKMIDHNAQEHYHKKPWPDMLRLLLEHGLDPLITCPYSTLYSHAVSKEAKWAFDILEEVHPQKTADLHEQTLVWRMLSAARDGDLKSLEWALKHGADLDNEDPGKATLNNSGRTALMVASAFGQKEAVEWLLDNKADVNKFGNSVRKCQYGTRSTALFHAAQANNPEIVQLLIDRKADVSNQGINDVWDYRMNGKDEVIHILRDAGADVEL